jgi:hypothetical protein
MATSTNTELLKGAALAVAAAVCLAVAAGAGETCWLHDPNEAGDWFRAADWDSGVPSSGDDANLDGTVDGMDVFILQANWCMSGATWGHGDFNYDTTVDFSDLLIVAMHFGESI